MVQDFMALSPSFGSRPAEEETINDPTNPRHYWRYRMHRPLEDLLADHEFISCIQELLTGPVLAAPFRHHAQHMTSFNLVPADPDARPPCMFPNYACQSRLYPERITYRLFLGCYFLCVSMHSLA